MHVHGHDSESQNSTGGVKQHRHTHTVLQGCGGHVVEKESVSRVVPGNDRLCSGAAVPTRTRSPGHAAAAVVVGGCGSCCSSNGSSCPAAQSGCLSPGTPTVHHTSHNNTHHIFVTQLSNQPQTVTNTLVTGLCGPGKS